MSQIQISENARTKIEARKQERKNIQAEQSKWVKLKDGDQVVLQFDPERDVVLKEVDNPKFGTKSKKYEYLVHDPNEQREKIFTANMDTAQQIDNMFEEGFCTLKIRREGSDKNTKYFVTPAGA